MMKLLIVILVLIIAVGLFFIFQIKMNNGIGMKRKKELVKKEDVPTLIKSNEVIDDGKFDRDVEVLDLNDKSTSSIEENVDTLDLDDLFKTISLSKVEEEKEFDFDLKRSDENKTA